MKNFILATFLLALLCFGAIQLQQAGWEKLLRGPFRGQSYPQTPTAPIVTALAIAKNQLNIHHPGGTNDPIAVLLGPDAKMIWARILVPQLPGKSQPEAQIQSIELTKARKSASGYKIFLTCYWTGGGHEGGIIYLDKTLGFQSFALSW